jgi:hypothetical protein
VNTALTTGMLAGPGLADASIAWFGYPVTPSRRPASSFSLVFRPRGAPSADAGRAAAAPVHG